MIIRKATASDVDQVMLFIPAVVKMLNDGGNFQWDANYPLATDFLGDVENNTLYVAVDELCDDKVVGVAALTTDQYPEYADVGMDTSEKAIVPHRVAVSVEYRGQRIAEKFFVKAEELAKELGIDLVRVDTNVKNLAMRHIIEKMGYQHFGDVGFSFKPADQRFCCFEKRL